jgi:hypothetical protein
VALGAPQNWNGHCEPTAVASPGRWIFPAFLLAACVSAYVLAQRRSRRGYGSNTNASDAVDAPLIAPDATPDEVLDVAVEYTFPASDPIAIEVAYRKRQ